MEKNHPYEAIQNTSENMSYIHDASKSSVQELHKSTIVESKLTAEEELLAKSNKNIGKVIMLSLIFLFMFSAFNSASNVITPMFEHLGYGSFGKISSLILYISFGINDFIAPYELRALSQKYGLFVGSTGYTLFMIGGLLLTSCNYFESSIGICNGAVIISANVTGSIACGFGAALLWLAMASYIDCCANSFNKGKFFGVFWSIFQASFILGNALGAYLMSISNNFYYFVCMSSLALFSSLSLLFLPNVKNLKANDEQKAISIGQDIKKQLGGIAKISSISQFRILIPYLMFSGFSVAVYSTFESTIVTSTLSEADAKNLAKTEYLFIGQGIVSVTNSYLIGKAFDFFSINTTINTTNFAFVFSMVVAILSYYYKLYGLSLTMGMLWTLGDSSIRTITNALIAKDFNGSLEAFAAQRIFTELGVVGGLILTIVLGELEPYYLIGVIITFTIITQITTAIYDGKKIRPEDLSEIENSVEKEENTGLATGTI